MNIILNCITIDFLDEEDLSDDDEGLSGPSDDEFEPSAPGLDSSCCDEDTTTSTEETTTIIRPPMILPLEERCDIPVEVRLLDEKEEEKVLKFVHDKCCCQLNNNLSCSDLFHITHYREMRNQCAELDHDSLDLVMMSQMMALMSNSTVNRRKGSKTEERSRPATSFMHLGEKVC